MELTGKVEEIIYYNDKNGYTVFLFRTNEKTVTCVGYIPYIRIGDKLKLQGEEVKHEVYGKQIKVNFFEKEDMNTQEDMIEYLSSGAIKGIGEKTAEKIANKFGDESIDVLKNHPEKLATVRGISLEKAKEIQETVNSEWAFLQLVKFLTPYGISVTNINNAYREYGVKTLDLIYEDPYILIDVFNRVEFSYIDRIASDLNFERDSIKRVKSGIKYCLLNSIYNGNTCSRYESISSATINFLQVEQEAVDNAMLELVNDKSITIEYRDKENLENERYVYLKNIYKIEKDIAEKLESMLSVKHSKKNIYSKLEKVEKNMNISLSEVQKKAIDMAYNNNVSVITGGPGTGKTTIIKCLLRLFEMDEQEVGLCAPTGRAAKRMTEVTGTEAKTIHRLLEIAKIDDNISKLVIQVNQLEKDIVIVDESSMLDTILFAYLLQALKPGAKLILIGDVDQLPAVGPGEILKDIINSKRIEYMYLDEIFRQAKESLIIVNAHKINSGKYPELSETKKDFFFVPRIDQSQVLEEVLSLAKDRLSKYFEDKSIQDIQVICPSKRGDVGTRNLNKHLQEILNKKEAYKPEKSFGQVIFRVGDKIMQTKNNYDIEWEKNGEIGKGIFNGDFGYITNIDKENTKIDVTFDDGKKVTYTSAILEELEHSYAITIHKSQGSEFDLVIIPIVPGPPMLYTRNLLYTGVTRAKKAIVLVGDERQIRFMVDNAEYKKRSTGLLYKLKIWK